MPLYLCKPGGDSDPWKYGVPVYAKPFRVEDSTTQQQTTHNNTRECIPSDTNNNLKSSNRSNDALEAHRKPLIEKDELPSLFKPIRKVRHSELVLVDQVSSHYNRFWLRLRWPGSNGTVAGYILLGELGEPKVSISRQCLKGVIGSCYNASSSTGLQGKGEEGEGIFEEENEYDHDEAEDSDHELTGSEPEPLVRNPTEVLKLPKCEDTGFYYPSIATMELLTSYSDGLSTLTQNEDHLDDDNFGELVFCRICREGLHDIDVDFDVNGQGANVQEDVGAGEVGGGNLVDSVSPTGQGQSQSADDFYQTQILDPHASQEPSSLHEPLHADLRNHPYEANPLLAPCECAGSMAFVHYLCVEQWRCRSNHPAAKNGLNCETCKAKYTLPPPPSRPEANAEDDWMDAMPQHVLNALRHPHTLWQIGSAAVRIKWMRPLIPVLTSPIVSLYCRARRTLKKRGVSRRRWACSLCRRRARWKCVRCLRSYYCSRQCQNVSWHVIHKHVCYKPSRFWQSVIVYGIAFIYLFPGVISAPIIYDLGFSFLWLSFFVSGIIGGGIATATKRELGRDIRGRPLEAAVIALTLWLFMKCWGLILAFFGETNACAGTIGYDYIPFFNKSEYNLGLFASLVYKILILPGEKAIDTANNLSVAFTTPYIQKWICIPDRRDDSSICLRLAQRVNPNFLMDTEDRRCLADLNTIGYCWLLAIFIHLLGIYWKYSDRRRIVVPARVLIGRPRLHMD